MNKPSFSKTRPTQADFGAQRSLRTDLNFLREAGIPPRGAPACPGRRPGRRGRRRAACVPPLRDFVMDATASTPLGQTTLRITRLGLGTGLLTRHAAGAGTAGGEAVVEHAYRLGLRFFDTAPLYGSGAAETVVGHVLRQHPRGAFVLATKVGRLLRPAPSADQAPSDRGGSAVERTRPLRPIFDFSYDGVMRSVEESLERLGLDRIDILHIHDPDDHFEQALAGAYPALDRLRREGVIGAVGVGMNQAEMLVAFARRARFDCFLLAGRYTLLDQGALRELLPLCAAERIAVLAAGVLNTGVLAAPRPGATYDYALASPAILQRAHGLEAICARHGVPLAAAALQFPLGHPAVAAVVVGCSSIAQVDEDVRLFGFEVPAALWDDLKRERLLPDAAPVP